MNDIPMSTNVIKLYGEDGLFNEVRRYVVPEYQRDYSWNEEQLKNFVESIRRAIDGEKVFMGTIQFSKENKDDIEYDIVDGQQRIITFILLLKVLGEDIVLQFKDIFKIKNFNGNDQNLFNALNNNTSEENRYTANMKYLRDEFGKDNSISNSEILYKLYENIFFVELITTGMNLPEIVGIFNTINTTGLDLNCTDIFKLQYYEYLHKQDNAEPWMSKICKIYDEINDTEFCNMNHILNIYKLCLVAKYDLKWEKLAMGNEAFFEEILTGKDIENYAELLKFDEFEKMVYLYKEFQTMLCYPDDATELIDSLKNKIDYFATDLIYETRYGWRYWTLPFVIAYFDDEKDKMKKYANALNKAMEVAKYLIVCSINYEKVVNPVHTFMCSDILFGIAAKEDISNIIRDNIRETPYKRDREKYPHLNEERFIEQIQKELFYNGRRSFIICQLSALLDEMNEENYDISEIKAKLFNWKKFQYDMEHICARDIFEKTDAKNIGEYNGIGNLVVLNRSINREIGNKTPAEKVVQYENSPKYRNKNEYKFVSVEKIAESIHEAGNKWTIEQVRKRANEETKKLCDFLKLEVSEV